MQKTTRIALLAAAALTLPVAGRAQQTQPAPTRTAPAQDEIARIQQRINALQQRASQDSAVKVQEAAFDSFTNAAIDRLDPTAPQKRARAATIKAEGDSARAAGDNARVNALAAEATQLQTFFTGIRQRALALPEVQERRRAYLQALFTRMNEIDPEAQALVSRLQQLRSGGAAPATTPKN